MEFSLPETIRIKAVAATEAVYRVSDVRVFDEALKFELRRRATAILSGVVVFSFHARSSDPASLERWEREHCGELLSALAAVEEHIRLGRDLSLISRENAERVLGAYAKIRSSLDEVRTLAASEPIPAAPDSPTPDPEPANPDTVAALNHRQQKIVEYLGTIPRAQISDIRRIFGEECSEKTLQRDLWQMVSIGFIRREGDNRWTTYFLARS